MTFMNSIKITNQDNRIFVFDNGQLIEDYNPPCALRDDDTTLTHLDGDQTIQSNNQQNDSVFTKMIDDYERTHRRSVKAYQKSLKAKRS